MSLRDLKAPVGEAIHMVTSSILSTDLVKLVNFISLIFLESLINVSLINVYYLLIDLS